MGDNRLKPPPITTATVVNERSRGVMYEFVQGSRRWQERQRRYLVVGGNLDGQRLTRWEISQSKWPTVYQEYHRVRKNQIEAMVWVYIV